MARIGALLTRAVVAYLGSGCSPLSVMVSLALTAAAPGTVSRTES